jgi:hypothetical protein
MATVLIVEDQEEILTLAQSFLEEQGHKMHRQTSGMSDARVPHAPPYHEVDIKLRTIMLFPRFSSRIAALARRPSGGFADFSEIGVHTCLCLKLVRRRGGGPLRAITHIGLPAPPILSKIASVEAGGPFPGSAEL